MSGPFIRVPSEKRSFFALTPRAAAAAPSIGAGFGVPSPSIGDNTLSLSEAAVSEFADRMLNDSEFMPKLDRLPWRRL